MPELPVACKNETSFINAASATEGTLVRPNTHRGSKMHVVQSNMSSTSSSYESGKAIHNNEITGGRDTRLELALPVFHRYNTGDRSEAGSEQLVNDIEDSGSKATCSATNEHGLQPPCRLTAPRVTDGDESSNNCSEHA